MWFNVHFYLRFEYKYKGFDYKRKGFHYKHKGFVHHIPTYYTTDYRFGSCDIRPPHNLEMTNPYLT